MSSPLTFGSLFAGIGGLDLGLERAGMQCRWQVEIDKKCQQVLAHHWPDVKRMSDVKKITGPEPVDLLCGGFPCQDLSVAGRRAGLDGERSGLWFEFLRIIDTIKPQWVIIENVPGLLSSYSGDNPPSDLQPGQRWETTEESDISIIFQGLAECGYWWAYRILDAQFFGVPQRRRRVFIVANLGDWRGPAKVLFESESSPWDTAPGRETGEKVAGAIASGAHPSGFNGQDAERENIVYQCHGSSVGPMGTLRKGNGSLTGGVPFVAHPLTAHHGRNCGEDTFLPVAFDWQSGGDVRLNISDKHTSALQKSQTPAVQTGWGVRRFTSLECERLMGFPDHWTAIDRMSDSARYKMLGNAVVPQVAQWIGERIMEAHFKHGENQ